MTLPNIPPVPTTSDWKQWATSLRDYLMKERAQAYKATPTAPQIAHKKADESASEDGVLIYNSTDEEMEVSVNGEFKRMLRNELEFLEFSQTETVGVSAGQMSWNDAEGTVDLGLNADVRLQLGQEVVYRVKNSTGSTITNGQVVSAAGTDGASGHILAQLFIADGTIEPRFILGIATEDIANGEFGYVTHFGKVRDIDTSVYSEGDVLFVSPTTAGALTATAPSSPDLEMPIAYALNSKNNGTIFVRIQTGYLFHEIYDVEVSSASNNDFLKYVSANQRWENSALSISDASDVTITSPSSRHILQYSGSGWSNVLAELDAFADVDLGSLSTGDFLRYNGTDWVNSLGELNILSDVSISGESTDQFLRYNGSNWVNATYSPNLNNLGDVNTTGASNKDVLQYNGSSWVDAELSLSDLSDGNNVLTLVSVPSSPTSSGDVGQVAISATHFYICTLSDTWRRIAHSTWT
jgi:hypothetical protein